MKEFVAAVEESVLNEEREARIAALMAEGKSREEAEAEADGDDFIEFKLDGRVIRAYPPNTGQLTFMMAALSRGQTDDSRFASIINVILECLRKEDKDYLEDRLLSRDPRKKIDVEKMGEVIEYLTSEWFARPTQPSSDSVG